MELQIVALVLWMILGYINLAKGSKITKFDYTCAWILVTLNIVNNLIN